MYETITIKKIMDILRYCEIIVYTMCEEPEKNCDKCMHNGHHSVKGKYCVKYRGKAAFIPVCYADVPIISIRGNGFAVAIMIED